MTRSRLLAILLASVAVGGLAGWFRPLPEMKSSTSEEPRTGWQLPAAETLERSSAALLAQARTLKWLGDAGAGSAGDARQDWTLKAMLPAEDAILLQTGKEALISRAEVGATLPDGSRLVAVRGDSVVIELDGCRMDRHLYPRASDSDSSECKTATPQKDTQQP